MKRSEEFLEVLDTLKFQPDMDVSVEHMGGGIEAIVVTYRGARLLVGGAEGPDFTDGDYYVSMDGVHGESVATSDLDHIAVLIRGIVATYLTDLEGVRDILKVQHDMDVEHVHTGGGIWALYLELGHMDAIVTSEELGRFLVGIPDNGDVLPREAFDLEGIMQALEALENH